MTRASNAEPATLGHREAPASRGRGDPAGLLRQPAEGGLPRNDATARPLWLGVGLGFLLLLLAWAAIFTAARHADTRTVPLQSAPARR